MVAVAAQVMRGSPERLADHKEQLQLGYLRAVVAASGCVFIGEPSIDEGTDVYLKHRRREENGDIKEALLALQLKATATQFDARAEFVTARMSRNRYDEYRSQNPSVPQIAVVMTLPELQENWVTATPDALSIRHCAYWVNLAGAKVSSATNPSFRAPTTNVLDDVALCHIMERIHNGDKP